MFRLQADPAELDQLPAELRERFPGIVDDLRSGIIDAVPAWVLEQLPRAAVDRIPEGLLAAEFDPTFVAVLGALAAVALIGFAISVMRAAVRAATLFLGLGVAAGLLLFGEF